MKISQGELAVVTKGHDMFPEGGVVKILSYNTHEDEYQVTPILESKPTAQNPYIMETEDGSFKMTQEEFNTGEFIPKKFIRELPIQEPNIIVDFITSTLGVITINVLVACSSALLLLEYIK